MVDGTQPTRGPELDDMLGRGFMGLMGASLLANPATMFTAMQNTLAPSGIGGPTAFAGLNRMMGGFTNLITTASYELSALSATSTLTRMAEPVRPSPQSAPVPKYNG